MGHDEAWDVYLLRYCATGPRPWAVASRPPSGVHTLPLKPLKSIGHRRHPQRQPPRQNTHQVQRQSVRTIYASQYSPF